VLIRFILAIRIRLVESFGRSAMDGMLLWSVLIGVIGGISSAAFREANIGLKWLLTGQTDDIVIIAKSLSPTMRLLIPTIGGICGGIALVVGARLFRGMRSQDYLEVIRLGDGVISFRPTLARLISSLFSISSGASIGREGGMVQLSALMASAIGRAFKVSRPKLRLLVACGGAAGIASAYNTPLAGALFVAEIVLQSLAIEALGPLIVASVAATITIRHWIGLTPIFASSQFTTHVNSESTGFRDIKNQPSMADFSAPPVRVCLRRPSFVLRRSFRPNKGSSLSATLTLRRFAMPCSFPSRKTARRYG
jgi:CIC family chloride channel protein